MYVCMYVCMYLCMYVWMYVCTHVRRICGGLGRLLDVTHEQRNVHRITMTRCFKVWAHLVPGETPEVMTLQVRRVPVPCLALNDGPCSPQ
jgi:hypothetical protein